MPPSLIERATRNARILRWWADCKTDFKFAARECYAQTHRIPSRELGDIDEMFPQDADVLDWLAVSYANTIAAHGDDQF